MDNLEFIIGLPIFPASVGVMNWKKRDAKNASSVLKSTFLQPPWLSSSMNS